MFNLTYTVSFAAKLVRDKLIRKFVGDVQDAARFCAERMRALCPVDTGRMRDSITVVYNTDDLSVSIYVPVPYSSWVEFGHLTVSGTWVPGRFFTRTAVAETRARYPWLRIVTMQLASNEIQRV